MKHIGRLAHILMSGCQRILHRNVTVDSLQPVYQSRSASGAVMPRTDFSHFSRHQFLLSDLLAHRALSVSHWYPYWDSSFAIRSCAPICLSIRERAGQPENSIKLLSYNIMSFGNMKKENGQNPILNYIKNSNADIVCMQEYAGSETAKIHLSNKEIRQALKDYPYHNIKQVGKTGAGSQLACYSKFPILSARMLDYRSNYNGSMVYEIKIGKDTVLLINNHLESNKLTREDKVVYEDMLKDPKAGKVKSGVRQLVNKLAEASAIRSAQARTIAQEIAHSPYPSVIVCGDFNDSPISYAHRVISQDMDDAFTESGCGLGISYNQNKFYFRIDNILVSKNLKASGCTVDNSIKDSDHYPIWCYITLPD